MVAWGQHSNSNFLPPDFLPFVSHPLFCILCSLLFDHHSCTPEQHPQFQQEQVLRNTAFRLQHSQICKYRAPGFISAFRYDVRHCEGFCSRHKRDERAADVCIRRRAHSALEFLLRSGAFFCALFLVDAFVPLFTCTQMAAFDAVPAIRHSGKRH